MHTNGLHSYIGSAQRLRLDCSWLIPKAFCDYMYILGLARRTFIRAAAAVRDHA